MEYGLVTDSRKFLWKILSSKRILDIMTSNMVEFSQAVYEFARYIARGQEDDLLKKYLDSRHLSEFPPGTFTDRTPRQSLSLQSQERDESEMDQSEEDETPTPRGSPPPFTMLPPSRSASLSVAPSSSFSLQLRQQRTPTPIVRLSSPLVKSEFYFDHELWGK